MVGLRPETRLCSEQVPLQAQLFPHRDTFFVFQGTRLTGVPRLLGDGN